MSRARFALPRLLSRVSRPVFAAAAMFAACVANAETYYFQGVPGVKTVATGTDKWKTEEGSSFEAVKSVTTTSYAITDGSAVCIITNGQIAATSLNPDANAYGLFGGLLELRGTSGSEALFINNGICNQFNLKLGPDGSFKFGGRAWKGGASLLQGNSKIEVGADTSYEHPARIYIFNATEKPSGSGNNAPASAAQIGGLSVNGSITGSGFLRFETTGKNNEDTCNLSMYSDCSEYVGSIAIVGNASHQQIFGSYHSSALGGEPQEFLPKGLELDYAWLAQFAAVNTGANRGLWIANDSIVNFGNGGNLPLTINGAFAFANSEVKLEKRGTSTLSLLGGLQDNAALGIFDITDGTLEIGGADVVEATFTGTATLKASQSATVKPRAASTFSGALNATETSTIDLSAAPQFSSAITCASGTSLVLPALGGSVAKAGSFSATGPVVVTVGDGSPLADGVYEILNAGNSITAATIANLSCANDASSGGGISFMSFGDKVLYLVVGDATIPGMCVYQGGASGFCSDAGNWLWDQIPTNGGERVVIAATGAITNDLGEAFRPLAIEFSSDNTALAQIYGDKIEFQPGGSIINHPAYGADFYAEVDFGDSPIDVSCPGGQRVSFKTMATGTHTVNHTMFWGNYTITADTWTLTTRISLAEGATVEAKDITSSMSYPIERISSGATLRADNISISAATGKVAGRNDGTILVRNQLYVYGSDTSQQAHVLNDSNSTGIICADTFKYNNGAAGNVSVANADVLQLVLGSGGIDHTENAGRWWWKQGPFTYHVMADSTIRHFDAYNLKYYNTYYSSNPGDLSSFAIDTTDWFDNTIGRTVTMTDNWKCSYTCPLSAFGIGTNVYNVALDKFTGGFTASNGVTVVLKSDARPGNGAVTMKDGTTLAVTNSVTTGEIGGSGTVTLEDGSTLAFNFSSTSTAPVLALNASSTLSLPASGSVKVKVTSDDGLSFGFGTEYAITSGEKFPADAVTGGKVVLSDDSSPWAVLYVNDDGNLAVRVAEYFYIKIAGSPSSSLGVPLAWIYENIPAEDAGSADRTASALAQDGANGIPVWQSYCLGLEPTNSQSVVLCEAAADQSDPGRVAIKAGNINIPEGLEGVEVTATLERKIPGGEFTAVTNATFASGAVAFITPEIGDGISFFA